MNITDLVTGHGKYYLQNLVILIVVFGIVILIILRMKHKE